MTGLVICKVGHITCLPHGFISLPIISPIPPKNPFSGTNSFEFSNCSVKPIQGPYTPDIKVISKPETKL